MATIAPLPEIVSFEADHPFLFLVREKRTGAILLLGRVANPDPSATIVPGPLSGGIVSGLESGWEMT